MLISIVTFNHRPPWFGITEIDKIELMDQDNFHKKCNHVVPPFG